MARIKFHPSTARPITLAAKRPKHVDPLAAIGLMITISFALLLAAGFGQLMPVSVLMSPRGIVIAALAIVSIVANATYVYLLDLTCAIFASQVAYATALAGIVWGMLFSNEQLTLSARGSIGLALVGLYLVETMGFDKPVKKKRDYRS